MPLYRDIERPQRRINAVFFIETGIASVVAVQPNGTRIEIGLIGREGLSGSAVVLGGDRSPHSTYIQVAGSGSGLLPRNYARPCKQAVRCASCFSNSSRRSWCRRDKPPSPMRAPASTTGWRAGSDGPRPRRRQSPSAHSEFLALMLGVRRPGVTEALQNRKRKS